MKKRIFLLLIGLLLISTPLAVYAMFSLLLSNNVSVLNTSSQAQIIGVSGKDLNGSAFQGTCSSSGCTFTVDNGTGVRLLIGVKNTGSVAFKATLSSSCSLSGLSACGFNSSSVTINPGSTVTLWADVNASSSATTQSGSPGDVDFSITG